MTKRTTDEKTVQAIYDTFPEWLKSASSPGITSRLQWNDGKNFILSTPRKPDTVFTSVYDAYTMVHNDSTYDASITFDKEFFQHKIVYSFSMAEGEETPEEAYESHLTHFVSLNTPENEYSMILRTPASWVYGVKEDFDEFFKLRKQYLAEPDNFELAYRFVQEHPMSWVRMKPEHTVKTIWYPHEQESLYPIFSETPGDGSYYWSLETGSHEEPDYVRRYFDPDLSVFSASSPEAAYIELARRIESRFLPTGEEK